MKLSWGARVSPAFRAKVLALCADVGIADPSWLMACIAFETGRSFDPAKRNPASGAIGLIQFMPSTASALGTSSAALAEKTAEEQLEFVRRYFEPFKGRIQTFTDCYMAILWPDAIGKPDDAPLFGAENGNGKAYVQNRGLDLNGDGTVTKAEATAKPAQLYEEGLQPGYVFETEPQIDAGGVQPDAARQTPQPTPKGAPMPILALLPLIAQFIPQIMTLIKPNSASTAKDAAVAGTILDTVVKAAGVLNPDGTAAPINATTVGQAADRMAADPALAKRVQAAVVTHPDVMPLLEVGGGVAAARDADAKQQAASQPFWKASAVFWVSVLLLPLVYWLVGSLIVGGIELPTEWPWYAQLPFKLLGTAWNGESRSGGFNLVIGLVLGGICGVYYGISVTQQKQQPAQTPADDHA